MKPCFETDIHEFSKHSLGECLRAIQAQVWYSMMNEDDKLSTLVQSLSSTASAASFVDAEKQRDLLNETKNTRMMLLAGATSLSENCCHDLEFVAGCVAATFDGENPSRIDPH